MQTLIDPFELASRAPLARTTASPANGANRGKGGTGGETDAAATRAARSAEAKTPYADAWTRVRWWCSEE